MNEVMSLGDILRMHLNYEAKKECIITETNICPKEAMEALKDIYPCNCKECKEMKNGK